MSADREPCPAQLLWSVTAAFEAAIAPGEPDPAARMLAGLSDLLIATLDFDIGDQPDAAIALARAIAAAAPLMAELSSLAPPAVGAATRGAAALAIAFGQTRVEVDALATCGLIDEFIDHTGAARAGLETAWRARRIAERNAAGRGAVAVELPRPSAGTSLH